MDATDPLAPRLLRVAACGVLIACTAAAAVLLLGEPCRGVADNLDYHRVARPAGIDLGPPAERPGRYLVCRYATGPSDFSTYFSSAALAAAIAKHLPSAALPGTMDLRQMGGFWLLLWIVVLWLLARHGLPWPHALALAYVLLDPGYLLFWNSFYADGSLIFALLATTAWLTALSTAPRRVEQLPASRWAVWAGLLVVLGFFGSGSKMQYVPFAAVVALALVPWLCTNGRRGRWRLTATAAALGLVAALCAFHFFAGSGARFPWVNDYHATFAGIARVSSQPEEALAAAGVPDRFLDLPRRDVFSAGIGPQHPVHEHLAGLSRWRLLRLYLADPAALGGVRTWVENELTRPRTHTRGNFEWAPHRRRLMIYEPGWRFGRFRAWLVGLWPPLVWIYMAAVATATGYLLWRGGAAAARTAPFVLLLLWFASQVVVVVLGDGFVAFEQHLVGARLALDLSLGLAIAEGIFWIGRHAGLGDGGGCTATPPSGASTRPR